MMTIYPWCPPPCGVGRVTSLVYRSFIISLMPLYLRSISIMGRVLMVNLVVILTIIFGLCVIVVIYPRATMST